MRACVRACMCVMNISAPIVRVGNTGQKLHKCLI